jgi:hypothetical protein
MVDEHASALASRREVRDSIDRSLDEQGARLRAQLEHRDVADAARAAAVDDPSNEQGAQALMALASGGRGGRP